MANVTRRYWVKIGSGSDVTCESLGLGPVDLVLSSLQPDVLTFTQHRVRGEWAVTLAHDAVVKFYRERADTTLEPLFLGRVVSPTNAHDVNSRRRVIRVMNVWQFAKEVMFHRGSWTPDGYVGSTPTGTTNEGVTQNGDHVSLYYGAVYAAITGGTDRRLRRQTVTLAVTEALDNLKLLVARSGVTSGWGFTVASNFFGDEPLAPSWSNEGPVNYLDWLVKCVQPVPDAFAAWDYSVTTPRVRLGRFRDQVETELDATGYPVTGFGYERRLHEEVSGLVLNYFTTPTSLNESDYAPSPGYVAGLNHGTYPASPVPKGLDRGVRTLTLNQGAFGIVPKVLSFLGESITQPVVSASLTAVGEAWTWLKPGAVLGFDGVRLNVQASRLDLGTETVSASIGMPRQLGVGDIEALQRWFQRWTGKSNAAA